MEEDGSIEFKEVTSQNPARTIADTAENYAVAFLNAQGGSIFWGIRDKDRCTVGVSLDSESRDQIRCAVARELNKIKPAIDLSQYQLHFHPVAGGSDAAELCIVELLIKKGATTVAYCTHSGEFFVRLNGVTQKLTGSHLVAWLQTRLQTATYSTPTIDDPKLRAIANRVRKVFEGHGLEPAHLARFLQTQKAPFSIQLTDVQTDAALISWLDDSKIDWIAKLFLIRREWFDGEDGRIHEEFCYDKRPQELLALVSKHADALIFAEVPASPEAHFLRWGIGKDWERKGECRVFMVLAIPLAKLSNDRIIYKYISDLQPYPWSNDTRTSIQLRAWARMLQINKRFLCFGREIPINIGEQIYSNDIFLRDVIETHCVRIHDDWHPEDYALYPEESRVAKDTETLPDVIAFLRTHNLPCEKTQLFGPR